MAEPAQFPKLNLNLLYPQTLPTKFYARFLKWLLTFGRYIAVAVEILVLATFAARFKLDADLAALKEKINQQIPFIENLTETESLIRQTQFRLSTTQQITSISPSWSAILSKIANLTPASIRLTSINLIVEKAGSKPQIKIIGSSPSNIEVAIFLAALRADNQFSGITLSSFTLDESAIQLAITGVAKLNHNNTATILMLSQSLKTQRLKLTFL